MTLTELKQEADNNVHYAADILFNPAPTLATRDPLLVKTHGIPTCYIVPAELMYKLVSDAENEG